MGIVAVVQQALQRVDPDAKRNIHVSFDIDGVDPQDAPSTGTPVPGGITYREARVMCEMLHDTGRVRSMDMVEVNPLLEPEGCQRTVSAAVEFILSTFGRKLL
jgi:arginase